MDGRQAVRDLDLSGATRTGWVEGMVFKGKYKLVRKLGRGGQSEAWQAEDLEASDDEQTVHVALKLLPQDVSGSHVELLRIRKSFQKTHDLVHQRIAAYRAFEQDGGDCMVVMELVPGVTLDEYRLEYAGKHGSFPLSEAVRICRQIAEGLDYAHSRQVAHRDVKPENIMVTPQGDVKIIDFGLASDIRSSLSRVSMRPAADSSGTNLYKAPEQWRSLPPQYGTDQYALAVVFYELLSGDPPFLSDDPGILRACVLHDPPQPLPMLSEAQNRALLKALAKEPEERFASCAAFIDAVEGGLRETASTPPAAQSGGAWRWIAAAALIMLAAGAYFMLQSSREAAARQAEQEAAGLAEATAKAEADAAAAAPAPGGQSSEAERAAQAEKHAADYARFMETGESHLADGRYDEAAVMFNQAKQVEGYASDEQADAKLRAVEGARTVAAAAAKREEDYANLMKAGREYLLANRYAEAEASFDKAMTVEGYEEDALAQAEADRQRAETERDAGKYADLMKAGESHLSAKRFDLAEMSFRRAKEIQGYASDVKAEAGLQAVAKARAQDELERQRAEAERQRAEAQRRRDAEYARHMDEGEAHLRGNRFTDAETSFEQAMVVEGYELDEKALAGLDAAKTARSEWETTEGKMQAWVSEQPIKLGEKLAENFKVDGKWWLGKGSSLISFAAVQGRVDVMEWLKANGEEVNAKDDINETPMHYAASGGHVSAMEWLKKNGLDVNAKTNYSGSTPMHEAAFGGKVSTMEWLKTNGADVNAKMNDGSTPMHRAAYVGHVSAMEWLKANGADVNAKKNNGETPFDSTWNDPERIKKWLQENGGKSGKDL